MSRSRLIAGLAVAALTLVAAQAIAPAATYATDTETVVPNSNATTPGDTSNGFPFNCGYFGAGSMRWQQVYPGSEVGPGVISAIAFRPENAYAFGPMTVSDVTITLSTTDESWNSLSDTFADNVGPDVTTVYGGALTLSSAGDSSVFDIDIPLQHSFGFDPANGNLLLDVTIPDCGSGDGNFFMDAVDNSTEVSRVYNYGDSTSATANSDPYGVGWGLITQFTSSPLSQTITFTSTPPAHAEVGDHYTVAATGGGSGNPVQFFSDAPSNSVCNVTSAGSVTFIAPGQCRIEATQAGGSGYPPAPTAEQSIRVFKATQTVSFTSLPAHAVVGGTYPLTATGGGSGNPVTFSASSSSSGVCTVSGGGTLTALAAGKCVVTAKQAGNSGYLPGAVTKTVKVYRS